jgi:hypothetical protein
LEKLTMELEKMNHPAASSGASEGFQRLRSRQQVFSGRPKEKIQGAS